MAVLVTITNRGGSLAFYDQAAPNLIPVLKTQPGFRLHTAHQAGDGGDLVVTEVWDSRDQHQEWFDTHVRPNIPPDIQQQVQYADLHSVVTP